MNLLNFIKDGFYKTFVVEHVGEILQQRYFHSCFFNQATKKVYIMGGIEIREANNEMKWINSVEYMNFDRSKNKDMTYRWIAGKPNSHLTYGRSNFNGFSTKEFIYVYGGVSGVEKPENTIERYNCKKSISEVINFEKLPLGFAWPSYGIC